jgi:hypothetical protein
MPLKTIVHKLFVARAQAAADSTFSAALATGGDFANKPATGVIDVLDAPRIDPTVFNNTTNEISSASVIAETKINGLTFSFAGGDANNENFTWKIFAWRNENGPAKLVADGSGILGTQKVVKWPHNGVATTNLSGVAADRFWADSITVDNEYWYKEVESTGTGSNSINEVWFDIGGYRYFFVEIDSQDGSDMSVYFGYF